MFDLTPFSRRRDLAARNFAGEMLREFFSHDLWPELDLTMRSDIKENQQEYIVEAELPGLNKEQINVELKDNTLTISANRDDVVEEKGENYIRKERRQGSFRRSFYVDNVDSQKVKADYKDGILKITLPKLKEQVPDTYKINID